MPMGASVGRSMMPSWSLESSSSASEHSMPFDSTPRIIPSPIVMFLPGMNVPGGENTDTIPVRAFGAPQTTCTGVPRPVSTRHTRKRSALGCGFASITRAIVKAFSRAPGSSTRSTSRPMRVSVSTISSSAAVVSRWSLSQERVNFIERQPRRSKSLERLLRQKVRPPASGYPVAGSHSASASGHRPRRRAADPACHI